MEHRLPGPRSGVEDQAVGIADAVGIGDLPGGIGEASGEGGILSAQGPDVLVVGLGDDEHVGGRLRLDVPERHDGVGGQHDVGGDVPRRDRAEQALSHRGILPWSQFAYQRPVRAMTAPKAATPAVEVRNTVAPSRTRSAPESAKSVRSLALSPPSGPMTNSTSCTEAMSKEVSGVFACSSRTSAIPALAMRSATAAVEIAGSTVGTYARRDCLAASRAVACHFAWCLAPRSPSHL